MSTKESSDEKVWSAMDDRRQEEGRRERTVSVAESINIVSVRYEELSRPTAETEKTIARAFGPEGLGILAVLNVPKVSEMRDRLLPLGRKFARLPEKIKAKYEHADSLWSFGWSHGKERLQGKPDFAKGSYYANPIENVPFQDEEIIKKWITFAHPNIWPTEDMPELEKAFMELGAKVVDVGKSVGALCDAFVRRQTKDDSVVGIFDTINRSKVTKARLLHYFSRNEAELEACTEESESAFSNWCGWHNDHGSLTGLVPAIYFDDKKDVRLDASPDPTAGLYLRSRKGQLVKAVMPKGTSLLYQIGETAQIHTGGILQATPHAVRGANQPHISRTTFAVFMEPNFDELMRAPSDRDAEDAQNSDAVSKLPKGVPPLNIRWGTKACPFSTCNFGTFTKETLSHYH